MYFMILLSLIMIIMWKFSNYMINFLIIMEYFIFTIIMMILISNLNNWIFLIYMVFSVCEAIIGLSLMVSMNFCFGHQNISLINLCSN